MQSALKHQDVMNRLTRLMEQSFALSAPDASQTTAITRLNLAKAIRTSGGECWRNAAVLALADSVLKSLVIQLHLDATNNAKNVATGPDLFFDKGETLETVVDALFATAPKHLISATSLSAVTVHHGQNCVLSFQRELSAMNDILASIYAMKLEDCCSLKPKFSGNDIKKVNHECL